jgi:hypothetical protein
MHFVSGISFQKNGPVYSGLFAGRIQDELGIAYVQERNSGKFRTATGNPVQLEKSVEPGYRYHVIRCFVVQPFMQYMLDHGNNPAQNKTGWLGMRVEANL